MTKDAITVLAWLGVWTRPNGEMCKSFAPMVRELEMDRTRVRRMCRLLYRKGLAEFHTALCNEDGFFRGAGYCISEKGLELMGKGVNKDAP